MPVNEVKLKVQLEGLNALEDKVNEAVLKLKKVVPDGFKYDYLEKEFTRALRSAASKTVAAEINKVAKQAMKDAIQPAQKAQSPLSMLKGGLANIATGATGGIIDFQKVLGMKSSGTGLARGAGGVAAPVAGAMVGVEILNKMAGYLETLEPIKAILTVVGAIFKLALLPLAMVLMAILMPFLLPLLQIMGKLPWAQFFKFMMAVSATISQVLGGIWNGLTSWFGSLNQGISIVASAITGAINAFMALYNETISLAITGITIVANGITGIWNWFTGTLGIAVSAISGGISGMMNWFNTYVGPPLSEIQGGIQTFVQILSNIWDWFTGTMGNIFNSIGQGVSVVVGVLNAIANAVGSLNPSNWHMPSLAVGGMVKGTGVALLHAGEMVVPAAQVQKGAQPSGLQITVNVTGNQISKDVDINDLARRISMEISNNTRRLHTW